ncbi:hypothetical protein AVEN_209025-1 [Araneus ventricosus]|uniref:Uncharacterized protein n=1 Tax=Araneus ventricosus TaxID=182803 RepID=A0A4Y2J815_ARAVE|nr:hypothetical protein AVEN_209025-1 [Araneus ventricosus]
MAAQKSYPTFHSQKTTSLTPDRTPTESCAAPSIAGNSNYIVQFLTVYSEKSPTSRITEDDAVFSNIPENTSTGYRKNTVLAHIDRANGQQITDRNSNSTNIRLLACTADKTPKRDSKDVRTPKAIPVDQNTLFLRGPSTALL